MKTDATAARPALETLDEAFHLVRHAPLRALTAYYVGSVPFVLSLLYFWGDMAHSAFARHNLAPGALGMALLFVWMKAWQAIYGQYLYAEVGGQTAPVLSARHVARLAARQAIIQPLGLLILPVALLTMVLFPSSYAAYQNACVLDDGHTLEIRDLLRKARALAKLWPQQNVLLIWALSPFLLVLAMGFHLTIVPIYTAIAPDWAMSLIGFYSVILAIVILPLSPFGMIIALNIGVALYFLPLLLHSLLGIQTAVIQNPYILASTSVNAIILGLVYLCLDPFMKAAYVLRCFYGESVQSGADLRLALRTEAKTRKTLAALVLCVMALFICHSAGAQETAAPPPATTNIAPSVEPEQLAVALDQELQHRRYAWRMPRVAEEKPDNIFSRTGEWINDQLKAFGNWVDRGWKKLDRWLNKLFRSHNPKDPGSSGQFWLELLMYVLLAAVLSVAAVTGYRMWRNRLRTATPTVAIEAAAPQPDLEDESTTADALSQDGWLEMANDAAARGDMRLALRALFLAGLSLLAHNGLIRIAKGKSNHDYARELQRRAHAQPHLLDAFEQNMGVFEAVWYGMHETSHELYEHMTANMERLRRCGQA